MESSVKSILLVDDDQDYKYFFYKALEQANSEVKIVTASDGADALNKLRSFVPDVIVLDLNMPGMNGMRFLKDIKSRPETMNIPVILYSTYLSMFDEKEIRTMSAIHVYTKPTDFKGTVQTINHILELAA